MEQLPIKKQITGTGFYLDEIEFLIFLIWLEKHNKVMMSDTAPVAVREFYTKCYRDGKIKDFRTAEVLANRSFRRNYMELHFRVFLETAIVARALL